MDLITIRELAAEVVKVVNSKGEEDLEGEADLAHMEMDLLKTEEEVVEIMLTTMTEGLLLHNTMMMESSTLITEIISISFVVKGLNINNINILIQICIRNTLLHLKHEMGFLVKKEEKDRSQWLNDSLSAATLPTNNKNVSLPLINNACLRLFATV